MLGKHPRTEAEIKLMEGRFGPGVTDGETNATLPKSVEKDQLTLEEAAQLIDARASRGASEEGQEADGQKGGAQKGCGKEGPGQKGRS